MTPQGYVVTVPERVAVVRFETRGSAEWWQAERERQGRPIGTMFPILPAYDLIY